MARSEYPFWLIRRILTRIRNLHSRYDQSNTIKIENHSHYGWANCHHKAKAKLNYRFNNCITENQDNTNEWNLVIASLKARLSQQFDNDHAWRVAEYKALEKINKQDFYIKPQSLIWQYVAVEKAGKINKKRNRRKPFSRQRTERFDWADAINSSKIRIMNYQLIDKSDEDELWKLCFKTNLEKIQNRNRIFSWNTSIYRNYRKVRRRSFSLI